MKKTVYNTQQQLERYSKLSNGIKMPLKVAAGATLLTALSPTDLLQAQCLGPVTGTADRSNELGIDLDGDGGPDAFIYVNALQTYRTISTSYNGIFSVPVTYFSTFIKGNGAVYFYGNGGLAAPNGVVPAANVNATLYQALCAGFGNWCGPTADKKSSH
ncbi:MAG: hypothetical protein HC892_21490 [Saprospiraceae bacterium]|nr:hypothetical protein [Saprospiraceae bacterium]